MIKLELTFVEVDENGKEVETKKQYKQNRVTARKFREALKFAVKEEKGQFEDDLQMLDELVELVAGLFSDPDLTPDSIYDGLAADEFGETLREVLMKVLGGAAEPGKHPANK